MRILHLPLKKEWYEMIESGEKREEYRDFSKYWQKRLIEEYKTHKDSPVSQCFLKRFHAICFSYGYTKRRMLWECEGITVGQGRPEWGAPDHETFIIKLGKRIEQ